MIGLPEKLRKLSLVLIALLCRTISYHSNNVFICSKPFTFFSGTIIWLRSIVREKSILYPIFINGEQIEQHLPGVSRLYLEIGGLASEISGEE